MGASLSWFAVRGIAPEEVLKRFGLKSVGREYRDTPFCGGTLPSGRFLVIHGRHELTDDEARLLSRGCEVIACFVEEHVMVSRAAGWKDGKEIWSVTHDAEEHELHLDARGEPPASFADIRDRLIQEQEYESGVDFIFDIPVALAKEITGYGYADRPEITFENFERPAPSVP